MVSGHTFNVTDLQPEYSFHDAQYEGVVNDSRLCSAGYQAAGQGQATEYEPSSQGNSPTEEEMAHQHLAVVQSTGASANSQEIFTGLWPNSMRGGRSATIGSVSLITRADQMAGANWPIDDV